MHKINHHFFKNVNKLISTLKAASTKKNFTGSNTNGISQTD
jgi:hypothetical protein